MLEGILANDDDLELELPSAMKSISAQLAVGVSFEESIKHAAAGGYGKASAALKKVVARIEAGAPVPQALEAMGGESASAMVKNACNRLSFAYSHGNSSTLDQAATELSWAARAKLRRYNSKAAFLGIIFVAASCILPALAAAYISIGSVFLDTGLDSTGVFAIYLVLSPAIDICILFWLYRLAPKQSWSGG